LLKSTLKSPVSNKPALRCRASVRTQRNPPPLAKKVRKRRELSATARKAIADAQHKRWEKVRAAAKAKKAPVKKAGKKAPAKKAAAKSKKAPAKKAAKAVSKTAAPAKTNAATS